MRYTGTMAKTYTRTGDLGTTAHPQGGRASKSDDAIEVVGRFDEAQVAIGSALSLCNNPRFSTLKPILQHCITVLFSCATQTIDDEIVAAEVMKLEEETDRLDEQLEPLTDFIGPYGCEMSCRLHAARVAIRRLERGVWQAIDNGSWDDRSATPYLNRLSDYLFAAARWANKVADESREAIDD